MTCGEGTPEEETFHCEYHSYPDCYEPDEFRCCAILRAVPVTSSFDSYNPAHPTNQAFGSLFNVVDFIEVYPIHPRPSTLPLFPRLDLSLIHLHLFD